MDIEGDNFRRGYTYPEIVAQLCCLSTPDIHTKDSNIYAQEGILWLEAFWFCWEKQVPLYT